MKSNQEHDFFLYWNFYNSHQTRDSDADDDDDDDVIVEFTFDSQINSLYWTFAQLKFYILYSIFFI